MANKKSSNKKNKKKFKILKKIARGIYYIISRIYNVIDKTIITPLDKLMLLIMKPFKGSSKPIDRLLNNKLVLITLSLVLALLAFFVVDNTTEIMMNNSA